MPLTTFNLLCYAWLGIALAVFVSLFFVAAPFGRHTKSTWGPIVSERWAWFFMELPSPLVMAAFLAFGARSRQDYEWIVFAAWLFHYAHRCFVFPFRMRPNPRGMPLSIMLMALCFNLVNGGINGYWLATFAEPGRYGIAWLQSPRFWIGATLFLGGMAINWISDNMLFSLRKRGESGYTLPRGFLFEYVCSPNLSGEVIEWCGFALMAGNLPALCFLAWTCANLIPRAKNHRDWSRSYFPDYPKERKILLPFLF